MAMESEAAFRKYRRRVAAMWARRFAAEWGMGPLRRNLKWMDKNRRQAKEMDRRLAAGTWGWAKGREHYERNNPDA